MANTYTQLYVHLIFAPKGREKVIPKEYKEEVHRYITGIVQHETRRHKLIAINCMPDHIHIFIELNPAQSISNLVSDIKTASTKYIKQQAWMPFAFEWQVGFGAFSYAHSQIDSVAKYVINQEIHHYQKTFREEYLEFLHKFDVSYDERYLFDFYD